MEVGVINIATTPVTLTQDLPGRISAFRVAEVRARVDGIVLKRLYTEGSDVKEGDQLYQKAKLDSGADLTLDSGGSITFEAVKDKHQESHDESSSSWVWTSMDSKGKVDETLRQSQLTAKGEVLISAVDGLHIDVKQVNQQTVSQSIDAMVQADPSMAWLKEVEARGDVNWRQVKEVHDKWSDSHSGLGGPAMIIIAIIVTYFTAGAASGLVGSAAGATARAAPAATRPAPPPPPRRAAPARRPRRGRLRHAPAWGLAASAGARSPAPAPPAPARRAGAAG